MQIRLPFIRKRPENAYRLSKLRIKMQDEVRNTNNFFYHRGYPPNAEQQRVIFKRTDRDVSDGAIGLLSDTISDYRLLQIWPIPGVSGFYISDYPSVVVATPSGLSFNDQKLHCFTIKQYERIIASLQQMRTRA
ncbi:MAG TPA: hypothetical protein VFM68_00760 [Candidatus Saccharimonadales bacterium]|nr:hypothetical protein [Candidatus Saccharimonadales bacterium]